MRFNRVMVASLGAAAAVSFWTLPAAAVGGDLNCPDFQTQEDAQAEYDSNPGDPHGLDRDSDGVACETLPSAGGTDTDDSDDSDGQVSGVPEGGVDTGAGSTEGPEALGMFAIGGVALLMAAGTYRRVAGANQQA